MTLRTIIDFLFGRREAILRVAKAKESIWIAISLVMLAGVARQYDQSFVLEAPLRWFVGPLVFSMVTGTILFWFSVRFYETCHPRVEEGSSWRSFMGCYWMTAPLAFLYAIPVDRFLTPVAAVKANLILFTLVALWRVILMGRVVSVVTTVGLGRGIGRVAVIAGLEFFALGFLTTFGNAVGKGMMGMENSPEETLVLSAVGITTFAALALVVVTPIFLKFSKSAEGERKPFVTGECLGFEWKKLVPVVGLLVVVVSYPQIEQANSWKLARFMETGHTRAGLEFLSDKGLRAFAPSRPVPPKLYEMDMYVEMGKVFAALKPNDPVWLRAVYLEKLRVLFSIRPKYYHFAQNAESVKTTITAVAALPEGNNWLNANREVIEGWISVAATWLNNDVRETYEAALRSALTNGVTR